MTGNFVGKGRGRGKGNGYLLWSTLDRPLPHLSGHTPRNEKQLSGYSRIFLHFRLYIPVIFLLKVYSEQRLFSIAVCSSKCELTMWCAFCLLMLVLTSECVRGERQQFRSKLPRYSEGPKERRIDKIPPCVHDEVLYCISCMGVFTSELKLTQIDSSTKLIANLVQYLFAATKLGLSA